MFPAGARLIGGEFITIGESGDERSVPGTNGTGEIACGLGLGCTFEPFLARGTVPRSLFDDGFALGRCSQAAPWHHPDQKPDRSSGSDGKKNPAEQEAARSALLATTGRDVEQPGKPLEEPADRIADRFETIAEPIDPALDDSRFGNPILRPAQDVFCCVFDRIGVSHRQRPVSSEVRGRTPRCGIAHRGRAAPWPHR